MDYVVGALPALTHYIFITIKMEQLGRKLSKFSGSSLPKLRP